MVKSTPNKIIADGTDLRFLNEIKRELKALAGREAVMIDQSRRRFLSTAAGAAAAGLVGTPRAPAGEGAPEATTVTLAKTPALCTAPQFIAEELLRDGRALSLSAREDGRERPSLLAKAETMQELRRLLSGAVVIHPTAPRGEA